MTRAPTNIPPHKNVVAIAPSKPPKPPYMITEPAAPFDGYRIVDRHDNRIATCYLKHNAAFVARRLNAFEPLLDVCLAVEGAMKPAGSHRLDGFPAEHLLNRLKHAIAIAEGKALPAAVEQMAGGVA